MIESWLNAILAAKGLLTVMLVLLAAMSITIRSVPQKHARVPILWALIATLILVVAVMLLQEIHCQGG